ncbi:MAG: hypothetical protein ACRCZK_04370 [Oscillospiraceae bacterium]
MNMHNTRLVISPKKYRGDTSIVSIRLPNEIIKTLDIISEKTDRNRNEIVMICLDFSIDNIEIVDIKDNKPYET